MNKKKFKNNRYTEQEKTNIFSKQLIALYMKTPNWKKAQLQNTTIFSDKVPIIWYGQRDLN